MKEEVEGYSTELRSYLLGKLSDDEQQNIEERLLVDDDFVEQMMIVEEDLVDSYTSGTLPSSEREAYQKLFLATEEGKQKAQISKVLKNQLAEFRSQAEARPNLLSRMKEAMGQFFSPPVLATAAALLVVSLGVYNWWMFFHQPDFSNGIAAAVEAYREERPLEARITGFPYAPFPGAASPHNQVNTAKLKIADKAFHNLADKDRSPAALHAIGKYFLTQKNFEEAAAKLEEGLKAAPTNAQLHADLAVALIERAKLEERNGNANSSSQDFARSRELLKQALAIDPSLTEARFNLALLQQAQKSWKEAATSWQQYLAADSNSQWAEEARRYLNLAVEAEKQ